MYLLFVLLDSSLREKAQVFFPGSVTSAPVCLFPNGECIFIEEHFFKYAILINSYGAQVEQLLRNLFGPLLDNTGSVACYLHAIRIRSWQDAGIPPEQLVARAVCTKARQLKASGW